MADVLGCRARFLKSLIRHKWFVLVAGRRLDVPLWRLLIHDRSKFSRAEFGAYARRFGAGRGGVVDKTADPFDFELAWTHHWHRNPHHWEYWLRVAGGGIRPMPMPEKYVREMVADWMGASRAYTGEWNIAGWYSENGQRMILANQTRLLVDRLLPSEAEVREIEAEEDQNG